MPGIFKAEGNDQVSPSALKIPGIVSPGLTPHLHQGNSLKDRSLLGLKNKIQQS